LEQIIEGFGVVNESGKRSIPQNELAHRLASSDPALMMFEIFEKCLQVIVGGGNIRDQIAREKPPPAMTHRLNDVCNHFGVAWFFFRFTGQTFQEVSDDLFDLAHRSPLSLLILRFETAV
jgi:hypothetical protein